MPGLFRVSRVNFLAVTESRADRSIDCTPSVLAYKLGI